MTAALILKDGNPLARIVIRHHPSTVVVWPSHLYREGYKVVWPSHLYREGYKVC